MHNFMGRDMAQPVESDPWNWQRWVSKASVTKDIEAHPDFDRLNLLIENKHQLNDADALVAAIQCLFDVCDSAALNNYIRLRNRTVHFLNVTSAALCVGFLLGRMAGISSIILGTAAMVAVGALGISFWVRYRTPYLIEQIESSYLHRKTAMVIQSLEQLGYQAQIVPE
jgi:hypothetical protein